MPNNIIMADQKGGDELLIKRITNTLESYTIPDSVTELAPLAFCCSSALKSVVFPANITLSKTISGNDGRTFYQSGISIAHLHSVTVNGDGHFRECSSLETFVAENITLGNRYFYFLYSCPNLARIDLNISKIDSDMFKNDGKLSTIILRKADSLPTCAATSFDNTPFKNGGTGGTIYIPKALYDHLGDGTSLDYKAASGWSTLDGYGTITWTQIEGSIYETQYADGTPIPSA